MEFAELSASVERGGGACSREGGVGNSGAVGCTDHTQEIVFTGRLDIICVLTIQHKPGDILDTHKERRVIIRSG